MAQPKTVSPSVEVEPGDEERIGTLGAIFQDVQQAPLPEVEVDPVILPGYQPGGNGPEPGMPGYVDPTQYVTVRVNERIEEMSYVQGGKREVYTFDPGQRYLVPQHIAAELEHMGKIWH